jgi:hypothetical protein
VQFPRYAEYLAIVAQRDRGLALVGIMVLAGLVYLLNVRFGWPWLLPVTRLALVAGFFLSAVVIVLFVRT